MKTYNIKVNGNPYSVTINGIDANGIASVTVNGKEHSVEIGKDNIPAAAPVQATVAKAKPAPVAAPAAAPAAQANGKSTDIVSPLPGVIISINVAVGDKVAAGQTVAVLEAMKMENSIEAESAGTVQAIHVQKGDSVLEGAKIVTIA